MKSNFHLESRQDNQTLHIHLHGTFDGASAFELIRVITDGKDKVDRIYIDTSRLTQALPFGRSILDSHLPKNGLRPALHFSGARAGEILPEGCTLLKTGKQNTHLCSGNCKNCSCRGARLESHGH